METAKLFINGGSQAVRLPRNCRFEGNDVLVNRIGGIVMLIPKDDPWAAMMNSLSMFTDDFLRDEIEDLPLKERES